MSDFLRVLHESMETHHEQFFSSNFLCSYCPKFSAADDDLSVGWVAAFCWTLRFMDLRAKSNG